MKKLCLLLCFTLFVLTACDKDDTVTKSNINEVILNISYDTQGKSPFGSAYLYYVENVDLKDIEPKFLTMTLTDSNGRMVSWLDKIDFTQAQGNKTSITFKWDNLPNLHPYGFPNRGKYVLAIKLEPYWDAAARVTSHMFDIESDMVIDKVFVRDGDYGRYQYEKW